MKTLSSAFLFLILTLFFIEKDTHVASKETFEEELLASEIMNLKEG